MNKIKPYFQVPEMTKLQSMALLLLRLVVGVAMMYHGSGKIQNPFAWMGPEGPPALLQGLAALSEFGGGLALVLGLVTPLAMFGLACTMAVATHMHAIKRGDPFVSLTGGPSFELALLFFSITLMFIAIGPGKFSLDKVIFGEKK